MDGLYHCTSYGTLVKILASGAFYPSYCLEKASYLPWNLNFAFAMVCFADLQEQELKLHMNRFSSDVYIKMKQSWAISHNISPVLYYSENTTLTNGIFRKMTLNFTKKLNDGSIDKKDPMYIAFNLLMAYLKQYKGHYYDKKRKEMSHEETTFYLEREWRYIPLVENFESYYLEEADYLNEILREERRQELIDHNLVARFGWGDIMEIGVSSTNVSDIINSLTSIFSISHAEAASKVKEVEFEFE